MKKGLTELVFILDRSGSMSGLEQDTIGGYNSLIEKQKKQSGEAVVTTVLFDNHYELLHDRANLKGIAPITEKDYFVRGSTALLDAVGFAIDKIDRAQKHTAKEEQAENVMFVITTDGMENASCEYNYNKIKDMIEHKKKEHGWEFLFIGANIDAVKTAGKFGIGSDRAVDYRADKKGTAVMYDAVEESIYCVRSAAPIGLAWRNKIADDYKNRI